MTTSRMCVVDRCMGIRNYRVGYCPKHYQRWVRHGTPTPEHLRDLRKGSPMERFADKVKRGGPTDCWLWLGSLDTCGYGQFGVAGRMHKAHRWSYESAVGAIPRGKVLDHLCRNRACVNPAHLDVVTSGENVLRGMSPTVVIRRLKVCKHGHKLVGANIYNPPKNPRHRQCVTCRRQRSAAAAVAAKLDRKESA